MATTDTTPVQPINYQSGLPQLMELLKYASGSKENQKEGGSQTQTQQGQSGPLEAILAQIMDPNGLQNMVANLFAQGAAQVPGLTTQYANAVGGRVTNNTLLGSSLAQLNQSLAQSIANAVVQQQQTAVGAAGKLAETNKSATTSKDLTTQRTTQPGNPANGLATTMGVVAAGTAANRLGKKFFPADAPAQPPVAAMPSPDMYQGIEFQNNAVPTVGDIPTVTDAPFTAPFIPGGDFISGGDSFNAVGGAGNVADASAGTADIGEQVYPDIPVDDFVPDFGGSFDDFSGFFFADGGRVQGIVPQKNWRAGAVPYADGGRVKRQVGYADGGNVRGKPNMGNAAPVNRSVAMNIPQSAMTMAPSQALAAPGKKRSNSSNNEEAPEGAAGAGSPSAASGSPDAGVSSSGFSMGMGVAGGLAAAMGLAAGAPAGVAIAAAVDAMAKSAMAKSVIEALTTSTDLSSSIATDVASTTAGIESAMGTSQTGDFSAGAFGTSFGSPSGMSASNAGQTSGATDEGSGYAGEAGMSGTGEAGASDAGGDFGGGDAGGDAGAGGDGGGDGGGGGGDGGGWADGGITPTKAGVSGKKVKNDRSDRIEHEGRGTVRGDASDGIDNTLIAATPGEYVLPIETVDFIGQDVLDDLVAMTHTPRRSGTHG